MECYTFADGTSPIWTRPLAVPSVPSSISTSSSQTTIIWNSTPSSPLVILVSEDKQWQFVFDGNNFSISIAPVQNPTQIMWIFSPEDFALGIVWAQPIRLELWNSGSLVLVDANRQIIWQTGTSIFQVSLDSSQPLIQFTLQLTNSGQLQVSAQQPSSSSRVLWQSVAGLNDTKSYYQNLSKSVPGTVGGYSLSSPVSILVPPKDGKSIDLLTDWTGQYVLQWTTNASLILVNKSNSQNLWQSQGSQNYAPTSTTRLWINGETGILSIYLTEEDYVAGLSVFDMIPASPPIVSSRPLTIVISPNSQIDPQANSLAFFMAYNNGAQDTLWNRPLRLDTCGMNGIQPCPQEIFARSSPVLRWVPGQSLLISPCLSECQTVFLKFFPSSQTKNKKPTLALTLTQNPDSFLWFVESPEVDERSRIEFHGSGLLMLLYWNNEEEIKTPIVGWSTKTAVFLANPVNPPLIFQLVIRSTWSVPNRLYLYALDLNTWQGSSEVILQWSSDGSGRTNTIPLSLTSPWEQPKMLGIETQILVNSYDLNWRVVYNLVSLIALADSATGTKVLYQSNQPV